MTETNTPDTSTEQEGNYSSLSPTFQEVKARHEAVPVAQRTNWNRQVLEDLTRGELAGHDAPIGRSEFPYARVPSGPEGYPVPATCYNEERRARWDSAVVAAHPLGIDQDEMRAAGMEVMNNADLTPETWRVWAIERGWPDSWIEGMLDWYRKVSSGVPGAAPAAVRAAAAPGGIAARLAEIDAQIYVNGKPNPAYFSGPLGVEYRQLLELQLAGQK